MRIHELAKELNTDSKTVIQILKENESIGTVKNHMSNVDEHQQGVARLGLKLDETSFDEYVDDDIKEKLHRIEPNLYDDDDDIVNDNGDFGFVKGTAGATGFSSLSDEDRLEDKEEEASELSFGQKAFAKAKSEEMTSAVKETEDHFAKLQTDAWSKTRETVRDDTEEQQVIIERPTGFWGWLKGLF